MGVRKFASSDGGKMLYAQYLGQLEGAEQQLVEALQMVRERHCSEYEICEGCQQLANWSRDHLRALEPFFELFGHEYNEGPRLLRSGLFHGDRAGAEGLLKDLQDLGILANAVVTTYTVLVQAALSNKHMALSEVCTQHREQTNRQTAWICTQIKHRAPQTIIVPAKGSFTG